MQTFYPRFRIYSIVYFLVFASVFALVIPVYQAYYGQVQAETYVLVFCTIFLLMYGASLSVYASITISENGDIAAPKDTVSGKQYDFILNARDIERFEVIESRILLAFWKKYNLKSQVFGTSLELVNSKYPYIILPMMKKDFYDRLIELRPDAAPAIEKLLAQFRKDVRYTIVGYALYLLVVAGIAVYLSSVF